MKSIKFHLKFSLKQLLSKLYVEESLLNLRVDSYLGKSLIECKSRLTYVKESILIWIKEAQY